MPVYWPSPLSACQRAEIDDGKGAAEEIDTGVKKGAEEAEKQGNQVDDDVKKGLEEAGGQVGAPRPLVDGGPRYPAVERWPRRQQRASARAAQFSAEIAPYARPEPRIRMALGPTPARMARRGRSERCSPS